MRRKYTPPREIRNTSKLKREAAERRQALRKAGLTTYTTGLRANQAAIVCLCCGLGSSNQYDIYQRYCGFCEAFHDDVPESPVRNGEQNESIKNN